MNDSLTASNQEMLAHLKMTNMRYEDMGKFYEVKYTVYVLYTH